MSSEPSERAPSDKAKAWVVENTGDYNGADMNYTNPDSTVAAAFDAGYSEGEKKGTAVGYLAALREVHKSGRLFMVHQVDLIALRDWLDRRIREAEENANG